jgi:hypothetical protein
MQIVVAQIIPMPSFPPGLRAGLDFDKGAIALNNQIAATMTMTGVRVVDMHTNFPAGGSFDGIHPNTVGESFMANQWMQAMLQAPTLIPVSPATDAFFWEYGHACRPAGGPQPRLGLPGPGAQLPQLGTLFSVLCDNLPAARPMFLGVDVQSAAIPIVHDEANCFHLVSSSATFTNLGYTDSLGTFTWSITIPNHPSFLGFEQFWQGVAFTNTGVAALTNAAIIRTGN